jgi:hypothetical protein
MLTESKVFSFGYLPFYSVRFCSERVSSLNTTAV